MKEIANREERYDLAKSADWQVVLRHFELGEGFAFIVVLVPDQDGVQACQAALDRYLTEKGKRLIVVPTADPADLENLASTLLEMQVPPDAGAVWVGHAVSKDSAEFAIWETAWKEGVARLNQFRNPLRRAFNVSIIFAGAPWLQEVLREHAPDLWSVRTLVAWVEPQPVEGVETTPPPLPPEERIYRPDPQLALDEVTRLQESGGSDLAIATMLYRAGLGFTARYQWKEAADVLRKSLELRHRAGAPPREMGAAALELGKALRWLTAYDDAIESLLAARHAFREADDVLGQASCIRSLGELASRRSDHEESRRRSEEALPLFREVGSVVGEANCIWMLGENAFSRSDYESSRRMFEEALPLYRRVGSVLGEANCIRSLGNIALRLSDHDTAGRKFEQALELYRKIGEVLGEASCVKSLGDIALRRSDYEGARKSYEAVLPLFGRAGSVLGEANALSGLGEIAFGQSDLEAAYGRYHDAVPLYLQVGNVLGEANCIARLGQIALLRSDHEEARRFFDHALSLYHKFGDPHPIGWAHRLIARVTSGEERDRHTQAARETYAKIDRADLIAELDTEFPCR